jgi:hypothetical protein
LNMFTCRTPQEPQIEFYKGGRAGISLHFLLTLAWAQVGGCVPDWDVKRVYTHFLPTKIAGDCCGRWHHTKEVGIIESLRRIKERKQKQKNIEFHLKRSCSQHVGSKIALDVVPQKLLDTCNSIRWGRDSTFRKDRKRWNFAKK